MPIADLQRGMAEVGRIRLGNSEETGKTNRAGQPIRRPVKLTRFRLTSSSRTLIEQAAKLYGGQVAEWEPQGGGGKQWEAHTEADSLPIIVPSWDRSLSQWYEQWTGGMCTRRCDGQREVLKDQACLCSPDPAERVCKPTTRLSLMLPELPGLGVWRLETHGYYAAVELPAVVEVLASTGGHVPGRLELEQRSARREKPGKPGEFETRRWIVPVIHADATPRELLGAVGGGGAAAVGAGARQAIEAGGSEPEGLSPERVEKALAAIAAADLERLQKIREYIVQLGSPTQLVEAWKARQTQLTQLQQEIGSHAVGLSVPGEEGNPEVPWPDTPVPPDAQPQPEATPAAAKSADRKQAWMSLVGAAGDKGMNTAALDEWLQQRFGVTDRKQISGEQMQQAAAEIAELETAQ